MKEEKRKNAKKGLVLSGIDKITKELQTLEDSFVSKGESLDLATRKGREATYSSLMRALVNELKQRVKNQDFSNLTTRGLLDVILQVLKALREETSEQRQKIPFVNINLGDKQYKIERKKPDALIIEEHDKAGDRNLSNVEGA